MSQVFRCYVEKRPGFDVEAEKVLRELRDQLGIAGLTGLRLFNRYDVEGVDEAVYAAARSTILSSAAAPLPAQPMSTAAAELQPSAIFFRYLPAARRSSS